MKTAKECQDYISNLYRYGSFKDLLIKLCCDQVQPSLVITLVEVISEEYAGQFKSKLEEKDKEISEIKLSRSEQKAAMSSTILNLQSQIQEHKAEVERLKNGIFIHWIREQGWVYNETEGTYKKYNGSDETGAYFKYATPDQLFMEYLKSNI